MPASELLVSVCCLMALVVLGSFAGGEIVFSPLRRAERAIGRELRFSLADLVALFVHFQCSAAVVLLLLPGEQTSLRIVWIAFAWLVALAWWIHGLQLLSEAGAERIPHRLLFLTVVAPVGYVGVLLFAPLALSLVTMSFICLVVFATGEIGVSEVKLPAILAGLAVMAALSLATAMAARIASQWLVQASRAA